MYVKKGEIWIIDLGTNRGSEQNGIRPCFIISSTEKEKTCIIIPASKTIRNSSFASEGFNLLPHQIRAIDKTRLIRKITRLSKKSCKEILSNLNKYLK